MLRYQITNHGTFVKGIYLQAESIMIMFLCHNRFSKTSGGEKMAKIKWEKESINPVKESWGESWKEMWFFPPSKLLPCIVVYSPYCLIIFTKDVTRPDPSEVEGKVYFSLKLRPCSLIQIHKYFMTLENENISREYYDRFLF